MIITVTIISPLLLLGPCRWGCSWASADVSVSARRLQGVDCQAGAPEGLLTGMNKFLKQVVDAPVFPRGRGCVAQVPDADALALGFRV